MGKELIEKRKQEFKNSILNIGNLPRTWQLQFEDGADQRLWFEKLLKLDNYEEYIEEIDTTLSSFGRKRLSQEEREQIFLNYISERGQIPFIGEIYFSDNLDMHTWYQNYKSHNFNFETIVHEGLPEYQNLNLVEVWPDCKDEFVKIIKNKKRIPNHGEVKLSNDIDVRVIYDKLVTYDTLYAETILLHLSTYKKNGLTLHDRTQQLLDTVKKLKYTPGLQEMRFTDGTDMFTWYNRYETKIPSLKNMIDELCESRQPKKLNIYFIPEFKKTGGKFYTICTNEGEKLDISSISSYEEAKKLDSTFAKRGGLILKKDEEIGSVSFKGVRK